MAVKTLNIIARKPRNNEGAEYAVIDRGAGSQRWVSCTITALSLAYGEWFWGYYFDTQEEAMAHFNSREMR